MKKRVLRLAAMGTISLGILLNSINVQAMANQIATQPLRKHNSDEIIMLRNRPIEIPIFANEREEQFRGVWVSTVYRLDFPSKQNISQEEYKAEYIRMLNNLESLNMNTVIFQVRPELDAFYPSNLNPWSKWLTGTQGLSPGWDPLEWMVEETHKRQMEFHAWFNPYRVTVSADNSKSKEAKLAELAPNNWARQNPQYVFDFGGKLQLNPGEPEVIRYIDESIMEVVRNYNIDAVHFDDYFYPFKSGNGWYAKEEEEAYRKYGSGMVRDEWRRDNVDRLVKTIHDSISIYNKTNNKDVEFGISPFGIWGKLEDHPIGSKEGAGALIPRTSRASYDDQFADTRKWVKNNWIDYIAPQIYWTFDSKAAPYGELVNWWADVVKGTDVNLYIGHANYRKADANNKEVSWTNPREISNQLKFNSLYDEVKGSIFFRYNNLLDSINSPIANKEFIRILREEHFTAKSNIPSKKPSIIEKEVEAPLHLMVFRASYGFILLWEDDPNNLAVAYRIYREDSNGDGENLMIREVVRGNYNRFVFIDKTANPEWEYIYSIRAVDRFNNESKPIIVK